MAFNHFTLKQKMKYYCSSIIEHRVTGETPRIYFSHERFLYDYICKEFHSKHTEIRKIIENFYEYLNFINIEKIINNKGTVDHKQTFKLLST